MDRQVAQRRPVRKAGMIDFPEAPSVAWCGIYPRRERHWICPAQSAFLNISPCCSPSGAATALGVEASGAKIGRLAWPSRRSHNINLISLPSGGEFLTLRDAANYITEFPKREHDAPAWRRHDACAALALPSTPEDNCNSPYKAWPCRTLWKRHCRFESRSLLPNCRGS